MRPVVLDASLALAVVLPDESSGQAERLLRDAVEGKIAVLTALHWPLEVANGLLEASRRERISREDRLIALDFLLGLPLTVVPEHAAPPVLFSLADGERLSIYDACYLALAVQRGARLATTDGPLRRAARRQGLLWAGGA